MADISIIHLLSKASNTKSHLLSQLHSPPTATLTQSTTQLTTQYWEIFWTINSREISEQLIENKLSIRMETKPGVPETEREQRKE